MNVINTDVDIPNRLNLFDQINRLNETNILQTNRLDQSHRLKS